MMYTRTCTQRGRFMNLTPSLIITLIDEVNAENTPENHPRVVGHCYSIHQRLASFEPATEVCVLVWKWIFEIPHGSRLSLPTRTLPTRTALKSVLNRPQKPPSNFTKHASNRPQSETFEISLGFRITSALYPSINFFYPLLRKFYCTTINTSHLPRDSSIWIQGSCHEQKEEIMNLRTMIPYILVTNILWLP